MNKSSFGHLLAKFPYAPLFLFVILPVVLGVSFYSGYPAWATPVIATAGLFLCILFVVYILMFRRNDIPAIGSTVPNLLGPSITYFYIATSGSPLAEVVHKGGAVLVQLVFFFAAFVGFVLYIIAKIGTLRRQPGRHLAIRLQLGVFILVVTGLFPAFTGVNFAPPYPPVGPEIMSGYSAPALFPLTICRYVLALYSVILAVLPEDATLDTQP